LNIIFNLAKNGAFRVVFLTEHEEQTIRFGYENSIINSLSSFFKSTLSEFYIQSIRQMLILLDAAENLDLTKVKTKITLPILKFRLGDTFRFVIYYINRHLVQAKKVKY
jgi:hypothetical protein